MSWTTTQRFLSLCALTFLLGACAEKSSVTTSTTGNKPKPIPPKPQEENKLPPLTSEEKKVVIDFVNNTVRLANVRDQLYAPKEDPEMDAIETFVYNQLHANCTVDSNKQKTGNLTQLSHSLKGAACPAKASLEEQAIEESYAKITDSAVEHEELSNEDLQSALNLRSFSSTSGGTQTLSMPNGNIYVNAITRAGSESVMLFDQSPVTTTSSLDMSQVYSVKDLGDGNYEIVKLLEVQGNGYLYTMQFPSKNIKAELKIKFSATSDGRMHQDLYLNGEIMNNQLLPLATAESKAIVEGSSISAL